MLAAIDTLAAGGGIRDQRPDLHGHLEPQPADRKPSLHGDGTAHLQLGA